MIFSFENDVEMYGAQTIRCMNKHLNKFENDVEMYGAQTAVKDTIVAPLFENDVEMYGAQTMDGAEKRVHPFENDVEMYGAQTMNNGVFTIGYRDWAPEHEKMGKGVTLTEDEMMKLKELL